MIILVFLDLNRYDFCDRNFLTAYPASALCPAAARIGADLCVALSAHLQSFAHAVPIRSTSGVAAPDEAVLSAAEEHAALIALAGRYALLNGICLRQALPLWWPLCRSGLDPAIRIGVSKQGGFPVHAWIELGGRPLGQAPEHQARLVRLDYLNLHQFGRAG